MQKLIDQIQIIIGESVKDTGLIRQSMTHRSHLNESSNKNLVSNERLEFLGDSVLQLWVSMFIYDHYPHFDEGKLTAIRTHLVRTETLATLAKQLSLGEYLLLSRGEEKDNGRQSQLLLANCFEALCGALFISNGQSAIEKYLHYLLYPIIVEIGNPDTLKDSKSLLQEKTQTNKRLPPKYVVTASTGPDHNKIFTVSVFIDDKPVGEGSGNSKQLAEEAAAKNALVNLGIKR